MFDFNNGVNKVKLNSFETTKKAKKEENKPQEKTAEASSAEALNSYGRAFVNLSFKGKVVDSQAETLTKEEQEIFDHLKQNFSKDEEIKALQSTFVKELIKDKNHDIIDIADILDEIKTNNKEVCQQLITFAKELLNDNNYNVDDVTGILCGTNTNNEEVTRQQIAYAKELIQGKNYNIGDIFRILLNTKSNNEEVYQQQIAFAKELLNDKNYSTRDASKILAATISDNKEVYQQQIAFAKELLQDKNYSAKDTAEIVHKTKTCNEQITQQQIAFAKELLKDKTYDINTVVNILNGTDNNDEEIYQQKFAFAKELLQDKSYSTSVVADILSAINSTDKEICQQLIALAKELLRNENYNADDIINILYGTRTNNKKIYQQQITLAKELIEKKSYSADDITKILYETDNNDEEIYQQKFAFAKELLQDNNCNADDLAKILSATKNYDKQIEQQLIILAKELIQNKKYNINDTAKILSSTRNYTNEQTTQQLTAFVKELIKKKSYSADDVDKLMSAVYSHDSKDMLSKIENAGKIIATINEDDGLTKDQAFAIITSKNTVSYQDVKKLQHKIGQKNIAKLSGADTVIACKLIGLYNAKDINQIPLTDKKEVIRKLVECNNGCFEISDNLKQFFPLIPTTQEEYCSLLPALVKAVGIETKELKEDEIKEFDSSLSSLGNDLAKISDDDFDNLQISQEYPKEDFIKDVFDIVKDLSASERQKVYDYFGFELHKNSSGVQVDDDSKHCFSIIGYPVNLNNGKKLAKIEDSATKEIVEKLRPYVIRYSENNKISVSSSKEVEEALNKIVEYLPEFRTAIDKAQHKEHSYTVANHSLKVMQKIVQNPEFKKLNESDKKLMLLSALLHDLSKAEGKTDGLHANNSAFDSYYISKKFNLTRDEEIKLYSLIKHHEWLGYVNAKGLTDKEKLKRQQSVAFDLQYDNLFDMSKIFTKADLKGVSKKDEYYNKHKNDFELNSSKIDSLIAELKTSQPLFPVTKFPSSSTINKAITMVNPDGSTNLKGIYKDENGLVIIRFNEVENSTWEKIGFDKGTISRGITTTTSGGDEVDTGNIHFFVHGLDFENQLSKFDAFSIPDSDALLSVSYAERPESKTRFFRPQGVILDTETKYTYGGGETDAGSGCGKDIGNFKNDYVFGGENEENRKYISDLIKTTLGLDDKEYLDFVQQNKNKSFNEIEPVEVREKLIKAFAGINSNTRNGNRAYNEMYISNPNVMGVFTYPSSKDNKIGDTMEFVKKQKEFLKKYALEHDIPMVVFGE